MFWHEFFFGASLMAIGFPLLILVNVLAFSDWIIKGDSTRESQIIRIALALSGSAAVTFGAAALLLHIFAIDLGRIVHLSSVSVSLNGISWSVVLGVFIGGPVLLVVLVALLLALRPVFKLLLIPLELTSGLLLYCWAWLRSWKR